MFLNKKAPKSKKPRQKTAPRTVTLESIHRFDITFWNSSTFLPRLPLCIGFFKTHHFPNKVGFPFHFDAPKIFFILIQEF